MRQRISKYRINPGNVGKAARKDTQFAQMIEVAAKYDKPVRIGVNWGSLDQSVLARIMDDNAQRAQPWTRAAGHDRSVDYIRARIHPSRARHRFG